LTAQDIYNAGVIKLAKGESTITAGLGGTFYHCDTIQAKGKLTIKAGKLIDNKGSVLAEQDLLLQAPIIQHRKHLQSNRGALMLEASQQIENYGNLVTFKQLQLKTAKLLNHTDLGSDGDLRLDIPE